MVNKKGFELQFHWILVLIAGAIILFFFLSVVQKQRSLSGERLSITLSTDIDAVFSSAIESKDTAQSLVVPKAGIAFSCSSVCDCNFWVGKKTNQFKDKIIFAPDFLEQGNAVAWSSDWNLPFRSANFLFLRNPLDKYFLVMDSSDAKSRNLFRELNKSLPSEVALSVISPSEIPGILPVGNSKYRFVFLNTEANPPFDLSDEFKKIDVSVVYVNSADKSVTFFEKSNRGLSFSADTSLYAGNSAIFAAVFAADKDIFECGMKKAFYRLSVVSEILRSRSQALEDEMFSIGRSDCVYSAPNINYLQDIVNNARVLSLSSSFVEDADAFVGLSIAVDGVDSLNNNLIQQSCPGIY
ncbi:hypothetical protein JW851_00400 [Candidatus Woesearchaeota archaeon]|nr:hypothetical protein [Candidatus Woesearchaeota archaeon]